MHDGWPRQDDTPLGAARRELFRRCPEPGTRWRHRETGGVYALVGGAVREADLVPVVVYEGADGHRWVRPLDEFLDGRFTELPAGEGDR